MAGIKEIRTRIDSVQQTLKITNAMYLISSSKLRKARQQLNNVQPYFLQDQLHDCLIFCTIPPEIEHIYFDKRPEVKHRKSGYIVITGDKGLAGAYNHNVLRLAEKHLAQEDDPTLFLIGQMGRAYFAERDIRVDGEFCSPCRTRRLPVRGTLRIFSSVCSAKVSWTMCTLFTPKW